MHLFRHPSDQPDSRGRYHINADQIAFLYKTIHDKLSESFWDPKTNHEICLDAMKTIRETHISKKTGRFLLNFTAIVREVYSHANYNTKELFDEDRQLIRLQYWKEIHQLFDVIIRKADHVWQHAEEEKMALLLQFASLQSLYKDVAEIDIISIIYEKAVVMMHETNPKTRMVESDVLYDYFDQIQLAYRLRNVSSSKAICTTQTSSSTYRRRMSVNGTTPIPELESTETKTSEGSDDQKSRTSLKTDLEAFYDKMQHEEEIGKKTKRKGSIFSISSSRSGSRSRASSEITDEVKNVPTLPPSSLLSASNSSIVVNQKEESHNDQPIIEICVPSSTASPKDERDDIEYEQTIREPSNLAMKINSILKNLKTVPDEASEESASPRVFEKYDYRADFERRMQLVSQPKAVPTDIPLIVSKPKEKDLIKVYRRKPLFDEIRDSETADEKARSKSLGNEVPISAEAKRSMYFRSESRDAPPKPRRTFTEDFREFNS
ncbi:unnamed protein product [Auanema sp. JU1783]|nr:unnamed protein product [Auanema sp. JU1783]